VQAKSGSLPDWRDAAAYAPLLGADRSLFAWEWLRRDSDYVEAAHDKDGRASRAGQFGLVRFEAPDRTVPDARPLWAAELHPYVLRVLAGGEGGPDDSFDTERFATLATLANSTPNEHLLLSDGLRTVRLDGPAGTFTSGPRKLLYALGGPRRRGAAPRHAPAPSCALQERAFLTRAAPARASGTALDPHASSP
jgi:hypothetical protein